MLGELAPVAGIQPRIGDRSDRDAAKFRDRMSYRFEHLADLLIATFAQTNLEPAVAFILTTTGRLHARDLAGNRALAFDGDAALELPDDPFIGNAAHFHVIR